jgi:hypothetical protein
MMLMKWFIELFYMVTPRVLHNPSNIDLYELWLVLFKPTPFNNTKKLNLHLEAWGVSCLLSLCV